MEVVEMPTYGWDSSIKICVYLVTIGWTTSTIPTFRYDI